MIQVYQRHHVHIGNTAQLCFNEFPELQTLGKWVETEGAQWSCLSLADEAHFQALFAQIIANSPNH